MEGVFQVKKIPLKITDILTLQKQKRPAMEYNFEPDEATLAHDADNDQIQYDQPRDVSMDDGENNNL